MESEVEQLPHVLTRGASAVGPSCMSQIGLHRRAEGLDVGRAAFLALLFERRRHALENGLARVKQQRYAAQCQ